MTSDRLKSPVWCVFAVGDSIGFCTSLTCLVSGEHRFIVGREFLVVFVSGGIEVLKVSGFQYAIIDDVARHHAACFFCKK